MSNSSEEAVSSGVAVILVVGVSVLLSISVGVFVLDIGDAVNGQGAGPTEVAVSSTYDGENVTVQVLTGDADEVLITINGSEVASLLDPSPRDTLSAPANETDTVSVITVKNGEARVLTTSETSDLSTETLASASQGESGGTTALISDDFTTDTLSEDEIFGTGSVSYSDSEDAISVASGDNTKAGITVVGSDLTPDSGHARLVFESTSYANEGLTTRIELASTDNSNRIIGITGQSGRYPDKLIRVESNTATHRQEVSGTLNIGTVQQIDMYWNSTTIKLYVNGVERVTFDADGSNLNLAETRFYFRQGDGYIREILVEECSDITKCPPA